MDSAFERLGLRVSLGLGEEEIREAYREKARLCHPDQGGSEGDFVRLQEAQGVLLSGVRRLEEWARVRGEVLERRGVMGVEMMDFFGGVSEVLQEAEGVARVREGAKTALARALTEGAAYEVREKLERMQVVVNVALVEELGKFSRVESGELGASEVLRHLVFLEKWQGHLRQMFGRLL